MLVDDPGAGIALDGQHAALQLGVGMGAEALFQGFQKAVGQALEGAVGHGQRGSTALKSLIQRASRRPLSRALVPSKSGLYTRGPVRGTPSPRAGLGSKTPGVVHERE